MVVSSLVSFRVVDSKDGSKFVDLELSYPLDKQALLARLSENQVAKDWKRFSINIGGKQLGLTSSHLASAVDSFLQSHGKPERIVLVGSSEASGALEKLYEKLDLVFQNKMMHARFMRYLGVDKEFVQALGLSAYTKQMEKSESENPLPVMAASRLEAEICQNLDPKEVAQWLNTLQVTEANLMKRGLYDFLDILRAEKMDFGTLAAAPTAHVRRPFGFGPAHHHFHPHHFHHREEWRGHRGGGGHRGHHHPFHGHGHGHGHGRFGGFFQEEGNKPNSSNFVSETESLNSNGKQPSQGKGGPRKKMVRFVKHKTVPDGTSFPPGAEFTKVWKVRNDSQHTWAEKVELVHVGGDLETKPVVLNGSLGPNKSRKVKLDLIAPTSSGRYHGFWRLREIQVDEQGNKTEGRKFGQRLWCQITVDASSTSSNSDGTSSDSDSSATSSSSSSDDEKELAKKRKRRIKKTEKKVYRAGKRESRKRKRVHKLERKAERLRNKLVRIERQLEKLNCDKAQSETDEPMKAPASGENNEDRSLVEAVAEDMAVFHISDPSTTRDVVIAPKADISTAVPNEEFNEDEDKYAQQLVQLVEMGFTNPRKNLRILTRFRGDLPRTIQALTRQQHHQDTMSQQHPPQ